MGLSFNIYVIPTSVPGFQTYLWQSFGSIAWQKWVIATIQVQPQEQYILCSHSALCRPPKGAKYNISYAKRLCNEHVCCQMAWCVTAWYTNTGWSLLGWSLASGWSVDMLWNAERTWWKSQGSSSCWSFMITEIHWSCQHFLATGGLLGDIWGMNVCW